MADMVAAPLYDNGGVVFNVKHPDFGAKVDGSTDDTAAFAAAVSAASTAGGGIVQIPAGTMLADPPAIPANVSIAGAGRHTTTICAVSVAGTFSIDSVSNVELRDFTFVGTATSAGSTDTTEGIFVYAHTADATGIAIRRVGLSGFKPDAAALRVSGSGDYGIHAAWWARRIWIEDCHIINYYDRDPTDSGTACYGILGGYGTQDMIVRNNVIDGSYGKSGIGSIAEMQRFTIEGNHVLNCGLNAPSTYYGYGIMAYSGTGTPCTDVGVTDNRIDYTNRAGIYIQSVYPYTITGNTLTQCDAHSVGLGYVGSGAIQINNSGDDGRSGPGTIAGNTIVDPGLLGIYLNLSTYLVADCSVVGNTLRWTAADSSGVAFVVSGRGMTITGNVVRGFETGVIFYNTVDDEVGDVNIVGNEFDCTGATSGYIVRYYTDSVRVKSVVITGNRFRGQTIGILLNYCDDLVIGDNVFQDISGTVMQIVANRATITGNTTDATPTYGIVAACKSGNAAARITITGNVMGAITEPFSFTENSGLIIADLNDFGTYPGIIPDIGDTSATFALPNQDTVPFNTTLTANRTLTLSGTGTYRGCRCRTIRNASTPGAFTLSVIDGVSSSTIYTVPTNTKGWVDAEFDGTNWKLVGAGTFA